MVARLSIAAALACALVALSLGAESSRAERSAKQARFVSKRYGYSIALPAGWRATYARRVWAGRFPLMDSGEVDFFEDRNERFFIVAATRVPAGTTLRQWERSHGDVMTRSPYCERSRAFQDTRLGGVAAREFQNRCLVHDAIVVAVVRRGRGYTFQFVSPKRNSATVDRRMFETGRRGFRFGT